MTVAVFLAVLPCIYTCMNFLEAGWDFNNEVRVGRCGFGGRLHAMVSSCISVGNSFWDNFRDLVWSKSDKDEVSVVSLVLTLHLLGPSINSQPGFELSL